MELEFTEEIGCDDEGGELITRHYNNGVYLSYYPEDETSSDIIIFSLFSDDPGKGYGREALLDFANEFPTKNIFLAAVDTAIGFYKKCGFTFDEDFMDSFEAINLTPMIRRCKRAESVPKNK